MWEVHLDLPLDANGSVKWLFSSVSLASVLAYFSTVYGELL